jgi:hypothetical protein
MKTGDIIHYKDEKFIYHDPGLTHPFTANLYTLGHKFDEDWQEFAHICYLLEIAYRDLTS